MNSKLISKSLLLAIALISLPSKVVAQNKPFKNQFSPTKSNSFTLTIDEKMTDEDLKKDEFDAKKFDFEVSFSGVKRNDKKEIIAIKIAYKDKDGNSGNYNVGSDKPIAKILITKQFDGSGKGLINIQSAQNKDMFANNLNMDNFNGMLNNDLFMNLDNNVFKGLIDGNSFNFDNLNELREGVPMDSLGRNFKSFSFKNGQLLENNPDMKLEEEKIEEDGTITKKYSDGKGGTMIFSERSSSSKGSNIDDLEKLKNENKIQIYKNYNEFDTSKSDLDEIKRELNKTKSDLEKLKTDLQKEKGTKEKK